MENYIWIFWVVLGAILVIAEIFTSGFVHNFRQLLFTREERWRSEIRIRRPSWQDRHSGVVEPWRIARRRGQGLRLNVDRVSRRRRGTAGSRRPRRSGAHTGRVNLCQTSWGRNRLAR